MGSVITTLLSLCHYERKSNLYLEERLEVGEPGHPGLQRSVSTKNSYTSSTLERKRS